MKPVLYISLIALLFSACKPALSPERLYGKWKYTKLEKPNGNPPSATPDYELQIQTPYVEFTKNNDLVMHWGSEVLAHGKFRIDGDKIQFNQVLDGGQTREFPFYVTEITDKKIVFETQGEDASRVTAVKQ